MIALQRIPIHSPQKEQHSVFKKGGKSYTPETSSVSGAGKDDCPEKTLVGRIYSNLAWKMHGFDGVHLSFGIYCSNRWDS